MIIITSDSVHHLLILLISPAAAQLLRVLQRIDQNFNDDDGDDDDGDQDCI